MVIRTQKDAVGETGGAAVRQVLDVVDFAGRGGLVAAAGPVAAPVFETDGERGRKLVWLERYGFPAG